MVGELFDVEEECAGDVVLEIVGAGVDRRGDADGGEGGVEDDGRGVFEAGGQPRGSDERVHEDRLLCASEWG